MKVIEKVRVYTTEVATQGLRWSRDGVLEQQWKVFHYGNAEKLGMPIDSTTEWRPVPKEIDEGYGTHFCHDTVEYPLNAEGYCDRCGTNVEDLVREEEGADD